MGIDNLLNPAACRVVSERELDDVSGSFDAVVLNTAFDTAAIGAATVADPADCCFEAVRRLLDDCSTHVKEGGLLFVYGLCNVLPPAAVHLERSGFEFKYWIACELRAKEGDGGLPVAHTGLLMYQKRSRGGKLLPFELNTKYVRIPYENCPHCGKSRKDWGGKKHLLNPIGTAVSDVWDFSGTDIDLGDDIPQPVLERLLLLLDGDKNVLLVKQTESVYRASAIDVLPRRKPERPQLQSDRVVQGDCTAFLEKLHSDCPQGVFDLAFADPPYNLAKNYSTYDDEQSAAEYIGWCNRWLQGMIDNLRPGGTLLVLNIPRWAIHHFNYLCDKMIFRNWIVWDALSTPAGKLLPAHYALLRFTKAGAEAADNTALNAVIDSRCYCLRQPCVKSRKESGDDRKERLTDVWHDIHRIKHKKDRDSHPCQLPEKLMDRIIRLFSNEGDLIFDPFGGAGTTAVAAKLLNRRFIITELDEGYVRIANDNLRKIETDMFGNLFYNRSSVSRTRSVGTLSKKEFESTYIALCEKQGKPLNEQELEAADKSLFRSLGEYTGNFRKLQAFVRRTMNSKSLILE